MPRFMLVANWIALLVFSWGLVRSDVWRTIIQVALGLFALAPASALLAARTNAHLTVFWVAFALNSLVGLVGAMCVVFGSLYPWRGTFLFLGSLGASLIVVGGGNALFLYRSRKQRRSSVEGSVAGPV